MESQDAVGSLSALVQGRVTMALAVEGDGWACVAVRRCVCVGKMVLVCMEGGVCVCVFVCVCVRTHALARSLVNRTIYCSTRPIQRPKR